MDLAHVFGLSRTFVSIIKGDDMFEFKDFFIIQRFLKQTKFSLESLISMETPPHLGMPYAIHVISYHFSLSKLWFFII